MAATIKDIAEIVGISNQAVSAVLNNKVNCRVSAKKAAHILSVAKELNYTSSISAKIMRGASTKTVAILVSNPFSSTEEHVEKMLYMLIEALNAQNYSCLYNVFFNSKEKNLQILGDLSSRGADRFIILGSPIGEEHIENYLIQNNKKYLYYSKDNVKRHIYIDHQNSLKNIFQYLNEQVGDNIIFLAAEDTDYQMFEQALKELSTNFSPSKYIRISPILSLWDKTLEKILQMGYDMTKELLEKEPETKAIIYRSDSVALGGLRYLHQSGKVIGKDILIATINNSYAIKTSVFPISAINHDVNQIVHAFINNLESNEPYQKVISSNLYIRCYDKNNNIKERII